MTANYIVIDPDCITTYDTYEKALTQAKRNSAGCRSNDTYAVYALKATVESPVPEAVVTEIA